MRLVLKLAGTKDTPNPLISTLSSWTSSLAKKLSFFPPPFDIEPARRFQFINSKIKGSMILFL